MVVDRLGSGAGGGIARAVAVRGDVLLLLVQPGVEVLPGKLNVELGVVDLGEQIFYVFRLEVDGVVPVGHLVLPGAPARDVAVHLIGGGRGDPAEQVVPGIPGLRVEQSEGVEEILHAQVHQLGVGNPEDALVEVLGVEDVLGAQAQAVLDEREIVAVAGAHENRVDLPGGAVDKVRDVVREVGEQRNLGDALGPVEAHGRGAVGDSDRGGAVLLDLEREVLGRVAAADDEQVLPGEVARVAEVVRVHDAAGELLEPGEVGHVRGGEVPARHDDIVELLGAGLARVHALHGDGEGVLLGVVGNPTYLGVELDVLSNVALLRPAYDVVIQDFTRRVRRDGFTEMLVKRVVGEFETFLRPVRPQVAVHAAVHRVARGVGAGPPGVVPDARPVALLLEAHQLWELGPLLARHRQGAQQGHCTRPRPDDGDARLRSGRFRRGCRACPVGEGSNELHCISREWERRV